MTKRKTKRDEMTQLLEIIKRYWTMMGMDGETLNFCNSDTRYAIEQATSSEWGSGADTITDYMPKADMVTHLEGMIVAFKLQEKAGLLPVKKEQ